MWLLALLYLTVSIMANYTPQAATDAAALIERELNNPDSLLRLF